MGDETGALRVAVCRMLLDRSAQATAEAKRHTLASCDWHYQAGIVDGLGYAYDILRNQIPDAEWLAAQQEGRE